MASRGALGRRNVSSCARTSRHRRSPYYARKRGSPCGLADLLNTGPSHAWRAQSMVDSKRSHSGFSRKEVEMYFGVGGLLIVLGSIALVLGYQLIGIILIILGLLAGGFGFYGSRRAP